ncbi:MAG: hypothetical protein EAZ98_08960 [Oscillatoriales cyanobacterium]|nr:MAG: hypothetical protein EAZ98_08960 [Oscillatoriales cyanobacterium]
MASYQTKQPRIAESKHSLHWFPRSLSSRKLLFLPFWAASPLTYAIAITFQWKIYIVPKIIGLEIITQNRLHSQQSMEDHFGEFENCIKLPQE